MQTLYDEHDIDYIVHGDDPCLLPDGTDAYDAPKRAGKFKTIERTEGVSTTDIVDRILLAAASDRDAPNPTPDRRPSRRRQHFCATARRVAGFIGGVPRAAPRDAASTVVYVRGAFDVFHAGHADLLRRARAMGDFVLVGVVNDDAVRARRGANRPVLNAQERALSVMACRHADEVIIAAPEAVTEDLIATFRVAVVLDADGCEGEEGGGGGRGGRRGRDARRGVERRGSSGRRSVRGARGRRHRRGVRPGGGLGPVRGGEGARHLPRGGERRRVGPVGGAHHEDHHRARRGEPSGVRGEEPDQDGQGGDVLRAKGQGRRRVVIVSLSVARRGVTPPATSYFRRARFRAARPARRLTESGGCTAAPCPARRARLAPPPPPPAWA